MLPSPRCMQGRRDWKGSGGKWNGGKFSEGSSDLKTVVSLARCLRKSDSLSLGVSAMRLGSCPAQKGNWGPLVFHGRIPTGVVFMAPMRVFIWLVAYILREPHFRMHFCRRFGCSYVFGKHVMPTCSWCRTTKKFCKGKLFM
jgi:hypothetical protein